MSDSNRTLVDVLNQGRRLLTSLGHRNADPSLEAGISPPFDRRAVLLDGVTRDMRVLEIGPSYAPLAPRSEGWNVCIVDHASQAELVEKYADPAHGVDVSRIEEVDVVWLRGQLDEVIPEELRGFDVCVASHVIEHTPDLVGFVRGVMGCLGPDGWLSLAIPDMRYCFDLFEAPTRTGEVVAAHLGGASRHRFAALFDHYAYAVRSDGLIAWGQDAAHDAVELATPFGAVRELVAVHNDTADEGYVDCHAWQFTPASFELAMLELAALELLDVHVASIHESVGCEFFVTLRRGSLVPPTTDELDLLRLSLLRRSVHELASTWSAMGRA